jgi:hypothetical protein
MQKTGETAFGGGVDGGGGGGRWCSAARSVVVGEETRRQTSDSLFHLCQRRRSRALELGPRKEEEEEIAQGHRHTAMEEKRGNQQRRIQGKAKEIKLRIENNEGQLQG